MTYEQLEKGEIAKHPDVREDQRALQAGDELIERLRSRLNGIDEALTTAGLADRPRLREDKRTLPAALLDAKDALPTLRATVNETRLRVQAKVAPVILGEFEKRLDKMPPLLTQLVAALDELTEVVRVDAAWSVSGSSYNRVRALPLHVEEMIGRLKTACVAFEAASRNSRSGAAVG